MRRASLLFALLLSTLSYGAWAQVEKGEERRLLRIESRVYGWYGIAEPAFDRTIGRRQLYKINGANDFLKGLDGRLVVLQGRFSEGTLNLGQFAPPPVSVPEGARRQRFEVPAGALTSSDGYQLQSPDGRLVVSPESRRLDLVVIGASEKTLRVVDILGLAPAVAVSQPDSSVLAPNSNLPGGALLELEMTQGFLDSAVDLGRDQAGLKVSYQMLSLAASQLRILLPEVEDGPWRLEGTVEMGMAGQGALAESSFVISARPLIESNLLYLEPNWDEIKLEGQLPFAFVLTPTMMAQAKAYLPRRLPVLNLDWVSSYLRSQGLLTAEEQPTWYLGRSAPGSLRLGLGAQGSTSPGVSRALAPDSFRLQLSSTVADRLVRRGVANFLNPQEPFVPNPPIPVGKALFVSIKVEKVFLRSLQSGYSNGAFRFQDLVVDVGWRAGPLSGTEPLLSTTGFIRPRLTPAGPDGLRRWDWDVKIESLTIRSEKLPGNKEELARELTPRLESELGTSLAQKQNVPARLPLSLLVQTPATQNAAIVLTELRPLETSLEIEGKLVR